MPTSLWTGLSARPSPRAWRHVGSMLGAEEATRHTFLAVTIHQFDANQYVRREATADFTVVVTERATGREVWRGREKVYIVDGSILSLSARGVFASVEDLRAESRLKAMNEAVDKLLDKPALRDAIRT